MAPIIVHVVEDHTVLYTAGAALLGAAIGVGGSWLQQKSKVGADKTQLKERLAAEEARLDKQLAHNRELNELEALRKVLDEGGEALAKGKVAMTRLANLWAHGVPEDDPGKVEAQSEQRESVKLAQSVASRLWLRLPAGDLVLGRYEEATDALSDLATFLMTTAGPSNYSIHEQEFERLFRDLESSILDFWRPAQQRYGPKVKVSTEPVPRED
jgi:hypothetical protein